GENFVWIGSTIIHAWRGANWQGVRRSRASRRRGMRRSAIGLILAACGAILPAPAQTVTVSPAAVSVHLGTFYQFTAKVTGISPTTVGWTVALPYGATGSTGTISAGG